MRYLMVGLGGFLGAIARYSLGTLINDRMGSRFPYGTFVVNCTGCFAIGVVMALIAGRPSMHVYWRLLIPIGFIGGYTTFSSFEYETLAAMREGALAVGLLNVGLSVIVGFICVWLGMVCGKALT